MTLGLPGATGSKSVARPLSARQATPALRFVDEVWSGLGPSHLPAAVEHGGRESLIQFTDPSVAAAITGLRMFRGWFEENRRSAPLGADAVLGILMANYGNLLQAEAVEYVSR